MGFDGFAHFLRGWQRSLVWLIAIVSAAWFVYAAEDLLSTERSNQTVRDLLAWRDVPVDPRTASPQEILARINEWIRRDHIDDAQSTLSQAELRLPANVRAAALYNIANARTRMAGEEVRKGDVDSAAALINLAKAEYRVALGLAPANWDMRYNIDVAMRVVRDLPPSDNPETTSPDAPKKLWTDLPGVPKGLP
jgi:mxaK protein